MKKTLLALAVAAALPAAAQAASFQDIAVLDFTASSSSASFLFSWADLISNNVKQGWTTESDGKYSMTLSSGLTKQILFNSNNLADAVTGDVPMVTSGSFAKSFSDLVAGTTYKLSFIGKWNGPGGANWSTLSAPSVSISPVPEAETYAMFLAGLGVIGAVARRRSIKR